jgi:hypothetical protein
MAAEPMHALDRDLYCLTCGYNLRGLSGDPVRCPECGNLNPIGDVEIPAEIITKQLRQMETSPALCVGAMVLGAPFLLMFAAVLIAPLGGVPVELLAFTGVPALACVIAWSVGLGRFRSSCLAQRGWGRMLLAYHLWGLLLVTAVVGVMTLGVWSLSPLTAVSRSLNDRLIFSAAMIVLCVLIVLAVRAVVRPLHARLTGPMRSLQREVAVTLARDAIRRRLAQQRRGLFG